MLIVRMDGYPSQLLKPAGFMLTDKIQLRQDSALFHVGSDNFHASVNKLQCVTLKTYGR